MGNPGNEAEEGRMERDEERRAGQPWEDEAGVEGRDPGPAPVEGEAAPVAWDRGEFGDEYEGERSEPRHPHDPGAIRAEDTEPYVGLQYVARLFKIVAMVVIVALTAEIVAAVAMEGLSALFPLFLEVLQGAVLAALLWGASDLTLLFIDVGHDVRAARVLLGRLSARMAPLGHGRADRGKVGEEAALEPGEDPESMGDPPAAGGGFAP
jgi:hypothetical protein